MGKLQHYQSAVERVAVKDEWLVYRACSKGFAEALGFSSPDMIIGRTDFDLLPKEVARVQLAVESQVVNLAQAEITSLSLPSTQHDQTVLRTPILSPDREVRGLDLRLLDSPGETSGPPLDYHALIHTGLQGTIVLREGKPLFVNNLAVQMFGYNSASDLLMWPTLAPMFATEDWNRLKRNCDALEKQTMKESRARLVVNAVNSTGRSIVLLVNAEAIEWHGQSATVLSLVDVSQQSLPSATPVTAALTSMSRSENSASDERYRHLSLIHI